MGGLGFSATPRFGELLSDLFGDEEDVVPPGIILENDRPEYSYSKRERLWTTGPVFVAANVGNVSSCSIEYSAQAQLNQPRMIGVVTGIKVCGVNVVAGDRYQLTHSGAQGQTPTAGIVRDFRWDLQPSTTGRSALLNRILNNTVGVSGDLLDEVSADVTGKDLYFLSVPYILQQGITNQIAERLSVFSLTANKALRVVFWGYERLGRPEEFDFS